MSERSKGYVRLALCFIGIFLAYLLAGALLQSFCRGEIMMAAVSLLNSVVFSAVTVAVYRRFFRKSPLWWGRNRLSDGAVVTDGQGKGEMDADSLEAMQGAGDTAASPRSRIIRGIAVTAVLTCALIAFFDNFYGLHGFRSFLGNWLFCLLLAAAAAIAEEVMFRAFLLDYVGKKSSFLAGLVVASAVFGLLHALNFLAGQSVSLLYLFNCIVAGVFMSVIYWEYGLVCSVLFHISWNAVFAENAVESKPLVGVLLLAVALVIFLLEDLLPARRKGR